MRHAAASASQSMPQALDLGEREAGLLDAPRRSRCWCERSSAARGPGGRGHGRGRRRCGVVEIDACMHASIAASIDLGPTDRRGVGSPPMNATLFGVPASHPSLAAELMLRAQGRSTYRRFDLVAAVHRAVLRALGFPGITVPGARLDGAAPPGHAHDRARARRAACPSRRCSRPTPSARAVEAAEAWGDEVLPARRRAGSSGRRSGATARRSTPTSRAPSSGIPASVAARTSARRSSALAARAQPRDRRDTSRRDLARAARPCSTASTS